MSKTSLGQALTEASDDQKMDLGMLVDYTITFGGKKYCNKYRYVVSGGTTVQGNYVQYNGETPFEVVPGLTAARANLTGAGIAQSAATDGQFLWVLESGVDAYGATPAVAAISCAIANATTGALTFGAITTQTTTTVGIATIDDITIIFPPGQIGFASDA